MDPRCRYKYTTQMGVSYGKSSKIAKMSPVFFGFMLDSLWLLVMFSVATRVLEVGLGKHDGDNHDHVWPSGRPLLKI